MARNDVHTVPTDKGWANTAGNRTHSNHQKKATAREAGRKQAIDRKAEHVIHSKDGTIAQKNSYGTDPQRNKG